MSVAYLKVKIAGGLGYLAPERLSVAKALDDVQSGHGWGTMASEKPRVFMSPEDGVCHGIRYGIKAI